MSPPPSDLPPWLLRRGARSGAGRRGGTSRSAVAVGLALALFGAGVLTGFLLGGRRKVGEPAALAAPPAACPQAPATACADGPSKDPAARRATATATATRSVRHAKPAPAAMQPLPERQPLDDETRTQALRAFAEQKAPELRDCLAEPDRGPPRKLGAAFEIDPKGAVDSVQILGADGSPKEVRRCYAKRLKRWRFPEDLLRGDEKLLVNFVL
jgi:hypothetical protein